MTDDGDDKFNGIGDDSYYITVENITARWNQELIQPTLNNISVSLKSGDLLAIIGPVGAGKVEFY